MDYKLTVRVCLMSRKGRDCLGKKKKGRRKRAKGKKNVRREVSKERQDQFDACGVLPNADTVHQRNPKGGRRVD